MVDGCYRIEKCWMKKGSPGKQSLMIQILYKIQAQRFNMFSDRVLFWQGFKVCRYLFVRCDNEPAPWTWYVIMNSQHLRSNIDVPANVLKG